MASNRSKSVAVAPIQIPRTGRWSFRVTGTIRKKQRKRQFSSEEEALDCQRVWELERILGLASQRPKVTALTQEQLKHAESAITILNGSGFTLIDAVRHILRNPPAKVVEKTIADAYKEFILAREGHVSDRQLANLKSALRRFSDFLGKRQLGDITPEDITRWLTSLECGKKSWNLYRECLGGFFKWACKEPRRWLAKAPTEAVVVYRKSETLSDTPPERMTVTTVAEMMAYLEAEKPHWVTIFALGVFAGVRPDGERRKLGEYIQRDGLEQYFRNGTLFLSRKMTKDRRPRNIPLSKNLLVWLERYPLTPANLMIDGRDEYTDIRRRFKIPYDGLRHTSISACAAVHGITEATVLHGNSESVTRSHYLDLMRKEEAEALYSITPKSEAPSEGAPCPQHNS